MLTPGARLLAFLLGVLCILALAASVRYSSSSSHRLRPKEEVPSFVPVLTELQKYWFSNLRPPPLTERVVVYCSGPLFNLSEVVYALGWKGLMPPSSSLEVLSGLNSDQIATISKAAETLGLNPWGLCGEMAEQKLDAYVPARDGFTLAVILAAIGGDSTLSQDEKGDLSAYMSKAIYAIDAFCLGGLCNSGIFNANGLQIDDGSATEVGMMAMRGMPIVIYRDQATSQLGPGVQNPMPIGNASATLSPSAYPTVQLAVAALKEKIGNVIGSSPSWLGSPLYSHDVPPPPLYIYWQSIGEAVFKTKFRSKRIVVDEHGRLDAQASFTSFFFDKFVRSPTNQTYVEVAKEVTRAIKQVEDRFRGLEAIYPEVALKPSGGASYGQ
jgi:hypothetical protein